MIGVGSGVWAGALGGANAPRFPAESWSVQDTPGANDQIRITISALVGLSSSGIEYAVFVAPASPTVTGTLSGGYATGARDVALTGGLSRLVAIRPAGVSAEWSDVKVVSSVNLPVAAGTPTLTTGVAGAGDVLIDLTAWMTNAHFGAWTIQSPESDRLSIIVDGEDDVFSLRLADGATFAAADVVARYTNDEGHADQTFPVSLTVAATANAAPVGVTVPEIAAPTNANPVRPDLWTNSGGASTRTTLSVENGLTWERVIRGASEGGILSAAGTLTAGVTYPVTFLIRDASSGATNNRVNFSLFSVGASTSSQYVADLSAMDAFFTSTNNAGTWAYIGQHAIDAAGARLVRFNFTPATTTTYNLRQFARNSGSGFEAAGGAVWAGEPEITTFNVLTAQAAAYTSVSEVGGAAAAVGDWALVSSNLVRINSDGAGAHAPAGAAITSSTEITRAFTLAGSLVGSPTVTADLTVEGAPGPAIAVNDSATIARAQGALAVAVAESFDPLNGSEWTDDYSPGSGGGTSAGTPLGAFAAPVVITNAGGPSWESRQLFVPLTAGETVDVIYAVAEGTSERVGLNVGRPTSETPAGSHLQFLWSDPPTPVATASAAGTLSLVGVPVSAGGVTFWTVRFTAPTTGDWRFKATTGGATGTVWVGAIIPVRNAAAGVAVLDVLANDDASRVVEVAGDAAKVGVPQRPGAGASVVVIEADGRAVVIGADLAAEASVALAYSADRGAGGIAATATLTATAAAAPVGGEYEPPTGVYYLTEHPLSNARLLVAGPTRLVVEAPDAVIRHGTYDETSRTTSAVVRTDNGWRSATWSTWTASGDSAVTASLAGRYAVPAQTRGSNLSDRARLHRALLTLSRTPAAGEAITVHPNNAALAVAVEVQPWARSAIVHAPAQGFHPGDGEKWAMVGGWFATGVTSDAWLSETVRYAVYDAVTLTPVSGWAFGDGRTLQRIRLAATTLNYTDTASRWSMGCDIYKADISALTTPGRYMVAVEGCGASAPFDIHAEVYKPLIRFLATGLQHCEHGRDDGPNAMIPAANYHGATLKNMVRRVTGRTAASVNPDGIGNQGKLWENNMPGANAEAPMVPETDAVLDGFALDTIIEGHRDAADFDGRPMHAVTNALTMMAGLAMPGAHALDWKRSERTAGAARPYSKTILGSALSGTVNLSDFDHATLRNVDGYARMQVLREAGAWTIGADRLPTDLATWTGATAGQFELGAYIGWNRNFQSWALNPFSGAGIYRIWRTRPDPWSTYCACAGFAAAALRMQVLGDTAMRTYYLARAQAAWTWAAANEGTNSSISYTSASGAASKTNWDTGWRTNTKFQSAKATAAVAMWALTGTGSYHDAFLATTNATAFGSATAGAIAYLAVVAAGLATPVSATLSTIRTNALAQLDGANNRLSSQNTSAFGLAEGLDHDATRYNNHIGHPKNVMRRYLPALLVWLDDPSLVSTARRDALRKLIVNELAFMTGRTPTGQSGVTMLGDNPPRDIQFADWQGMGRDYAPPGIVLFGYIGNNELSGASLAGYEVAGSTNASAIPYPLRVVRGRGVSGTAGEFIVDRSQMEALVLALSAHQATIL